MKISSLKPPRSDHGTIRNLV